MVFHFHACLSQCRPGKADFQRGAVPKCVGHGDRSLIPSHPFRFDVWKAPEWRAESDVNFALAFTGFEL